MREYLQQHLPILYMGMQRWYRAGRDLGGRYFGTRLQEWIWSRRGLDEIQKGLGAERQVHRQFLVSELRHLGQISSLLEVGSGFGPNLLLLARQFPHASLAGADINPISVRVGREWFSSKGIANVHLVAARADRLRQFADHSYDVVLTDALLMYIGPDKIGRVMAELRRIVGRVLVLVEQHCDHQPHDPHGLGTYQDGRWLRNYVDLLQRCLPNASVSLTKVPPEVWPDPYWQRYGYLIRAFVRP